MLTSVYLQPLTSSLWTAVGDLFLFVRQSRTVVALDTALPARVLNRLKDVVRGESKVSTVGTMHRGKPILTRTSRSQESCVV